MTHTKPLHKHDCDHCKFLGVARGKDIYFCPAGGFDVPIIIRSSSEGSDYESYRQSQVQKQMVMVDDIWVYALGLYDGYVVGVVDGVAQSLQRTAEPW